MEEVGAPLQSTYIAQLEWPLQDGLLWPAAQITDFPWVRALPKFTGMPAPAQPNFRWVRKEAVGVVAAVTPWNFPFEIVLNKIGQALATGNTMIIKPSRQTPYSTTRLGRLIVEKTDIPAGVVNILTTTDRRLGDQLFTDPRIDMVSFTGSTGVGEHIIKLSAPTFKRTLLELGGKSANIILDDAPDFAAAVGGAAFACIHAGQGCALPTRVLLPRSRYDEGVAILTQAFENIVWGDPWDMATLAGPLITAEHRAKVDGHVQRAVADGARLVVGGHVVEDLPGYFYEPTLLVDVDNDSAIAQQEVFGPVLGVTAYEDDDDAVRLANASTYGLSGWINGSPERAFAIADRIRTGSLIINGGQFYGADAPYGGYKSSGLGRQSGLEGFESYLQTKAIGSATPLPSLA